MALVDSITVRAAAGTGGEGVVRWLHTKGKDKGGPSGGDGGRGGDFIIHAVRDLGVLARYKGRAEFKAEHGDPGGNNNMHGKNGEPVIFEVPVGSSITRVATGEVFDLVTDNQRVVVLRGGNGGYGNSHFKSATNQNPFDSRPGQAGESDSLKIELKIIADGGLVGLPNAGKSSLLNALTAARSKIGDYPFTTLEPHLGVLFGYVLADIPGLIEGAHEGRGLGHGFLRHISRTKVLIHCVAGDSTDPVADYTTVRAELREHGDGLDNKPELIFITKTDTISASRFDEIAKTLESMGKKVVGVSVLDDGLVKNASDLIVQFLAKAV